MGFKNNTEIVLHELNTVLDKIDSAVINQDVYKRQVRFQPE